MTKSTYRIRIRRMLNECGPLSSSEISRDLEICLNYVCTHLRKMELDGEVERIGQDDDKILWASRGETGCAPSSIVAQAIRGRTPLEMVWSAA